GKRRRKARRIEARIPFTFGADLAFGISLRVPRRRRRTRGQVRDLAKAFARSALLVINIAAPAAILSGTTDLAQLGALVFPRRQAPPLELAPLPTIVRSELQARRTLTTVTSPDAPQVRAHVVTTGETLLSIASRFGVAPQTIAYDNGISDSAQLKVGASLVIPPFDAAIHVMAA